MSIPMLPTSRQQLPVVPDTSPDQNSPPSLIARGAVFGLLLSVPLWIALVVAVWRLVV